MKKEDRIFLIVLFVVLIVSFFLDSLVASSVGEVGGIGTIFSVEVMVVLLVVLSLYLYRTNKKLILPIWVSFVVSGVFSIILKLLVARPRLFVEKFYALGVPNYSFPSTHAALAFAVLPFLWGKSKWYWLGYGVLVLISRILLRQHYLSDVVGGALLGYLVGLGMVYLFKKYRA